MSLEIGPLPRFHPPLQTAGKPAAPAAGFGVELARADRAHVSIPAAPPPEVLAEVGAAADRADELARQNRELHFRTDEATGRVVVEVRDLDGAVIRTVPPSEALEIMAGASL